MLPVHADIAGCPSIADGKVSTAVTVVFIPDGTRAWSNALCCNDVSEAGEWQRRRSEDGECFWASSLWPGGVEFPDFFATMRISFATTHQNIEDCLCRYSRISATRPQFLAFSAGGCPVRRVWTSAVEFGSRHPESVRKKSSASKKQDSVDSFIIRILDQLLVSSGGAETQYYDRQHYWRFDLLLVEEICR